MSSGRGSSCNWPRGEAPARSRWRFASTAWLPWASIGPSTISRALDVRRISPRRVGEASIKPTERGYPNELWTLRLLATHARDNAAAAGHPCLAELAASTVHAILQANAIKLHKVRYYLERRDPDYKDRMAAVVETYAAAEMLRDMPAAERPAAILS